MLSRPQTWPLRLVLALILVLMLSALANCYNALLGNSDNRSEIRDSGGRKRARRWELSGVLYIIGV